MFVLHIFGKMNAHKIGLVINIFHTDNFRKVGILWCTVLI
jgi:hypothetical protein